MWRPLYAIQALLVFTFSVQKNKHKNHVYHMYITIRLNKTLLGKKQYRLQVGNFNTLSPKE